MIVEVDSWGQGWPMSLKGEPKAYTQLPLSFLSTFGFGTFGFETFGCTHAVMHYGSLCHMKY
jgi:hypothetical protein